MINVKHAVQRMQLKELAIENSYPQIRLMLGLFKMNKRNTPTISNIIFKSWFKYS